MADTMTLEQVRSNMLYAMNSMLKDDTRRMVVDWYNAIDAAIKKSERGANSPLKGWIFDKVNIGRGDERYICTPDGANATTVRNESTSDHRERLLWLIADAMAKESGNG